MFDKYRTTDNSDNFYSIITNSTTGVYASNESDLSEKRTEVENVSFKGNSPQK